MKLIFRKIRIHNFKSFEDQDFDFSAMSGLTLVCGKNHDIPGQTNAAGKSSIFDALLYVLFGQLQTNVKNKNLRNRYSKDLSMEVLLDFSVDSKSYVISRGLNKYGSSFLKLVFIESDGKETDITKSSIYETEEFLEKEVLHCDVSIFLRTILLSSDQNYNFFLLSQSSKKDFVEKLFNIRIFGEMYSMIHRDILKFEKEFSVKQNELIMLNKSKSEFEERQSNYEKTKDSRLQDLNKRIDELKKSLENLKSKQISVDQDKISKYENKANELIKKQSETKSKLKILSKKEKETLAKKVKAEASKSSAEKTKLSYSSLLEKLCEHCRPIVFKHYELDKVDKSIAVLTQDIETISTALKSIEKDVNDLNSKSVKIEEGIALIGKKIHEMTDKSNKISLEMSSLEKEIALNKENLVRIKNEENPYSQLFQDTVRKIEAENEVLNEMSDKFNYMKMAENVVSQDTLKKFIIKDLITLLNSKIKYYLTRLGAKHTCVFNEDMDYTFITPDDGGETEYATFSAGERMRLCIASSFAFRDFMSSRNNFTSNILILDEFIDSAIDTLAVNNILKLLQEFSRTNNQHILIISHRKEIDNSIFDNIVMVEKRQNISTISYLPPER